ncbi:CPBP family intramembrane glutamic endopeptidase [Candidatus Leptofilum sp.]|uniref:CPBP family intramembrane glutamic endopeptidase n=1 Tax=Candidatus Leptofilum sp. TaxID=3241576 RepID=UPI003B5B4539
MVKIKDLIKKYPLLVYFFLAFVISWGAIFILAGPDGIPATADQIVVLGIAMLLGPSLAGIFMIGLVNGKMGFRELFSRLFKWRVGIQWYLVALLIAPLSTVAVCFVLSFFSSEFLPAIYTANDKATLILTGIAGGLIVGFFEDLGWTGFAIPRMRLRYTVFATGLIVGLLWGAWHFLLFWENDSFSGAFPVALLLARLFAWLPAYRILMVWVYNRTDSLLIAILMHVSLVATLSTLDPPATGGSLLIFILVRAAILWLIVVAVAMVKRDQLIEDRHCSQTRLTPTTTH